MGISSSDLNRQRGLGNPTKTTDFVTLANQFIMEYLVATRDLGPNTVLSYRDSIVLLIIFVSNAHGKRLEALEITDITVERVEELLGWLESERTNNPSTRNIGPTAIHSLFKYPCSQRPEYIFHSQQVLSIPAKKTAQTGVAYLDTVQTGKLPAVSNATTAKGKRDLTLLYLPYDSGCRMWELADVWMNDTRFTVPPSGDAYK